MEIKYEAVFGDQALFDDAHNEATHATSGHGFYKVNEDGLMEYLSNGVMNGNKNETLTAYLIAERRIIHTPTWTVADQKAGKLPAVGSRYLGKDGQELTCVFVDSFDDVWGVTDDRTMYVWERSRIRPIETAEEKAARLREEWCSNALDSASILSGMREYDLKRLGGYIGNIYDALLSGDLQVPKVVSDGAA